MAEEGAGKDTSQLSTAHTDTSHHLPSSNNNPSASTPSTVTGDLTSVTHRVPTLTPTAVGSHYQTTSAIPITPSSTSLRSVTSPENKKLTAESPQLSPFKPTLQVDTLSKESVLAAPVTTETPSVVTTITSKFNFTNPFSPSFKRKSAKSDENPPICGLENPPAIHSDNRSVNASYSASLPRQESFPSIKNNCHTGKA